jgi:hypothetical protein
MRRGDAAKKQKKEIMLQIIALLFSWDRQTVYEQQDEH